jgi:hypothetical protein
MLDIGAYVHMYVYRYEVFAQTSILRLPTFIYVRKLVIFKVVYKYNQGDQIGRFTYPLLGDCLLLIVFENAGVALIFSNFLQSKMYVLSLRKKMARATFWAIFFTNSSGHLFTM